MSNVGDAQSTTKNLQQIKKFLYDPTPYVNDLFGHEVHLFMHCHMKGYDRTGEGLHLDRSFFDKYGAPVELENFWMEGYHAMDRLLAQHMLALNNREIPFPPVAGYAGTTHLYKVATDHADQTWNWTGWVPRWRREILWDPTDKKNKFINNRFFMALRTHEVQNNAWDYHPLEDVEGPYDDVQGMKIRLPEHDDVDGHESCGQTDKYRGGYFFEGNSWGRYLHINNMKSFAIDPELDDFKRYSYIVHPLAYRATTNNLPDNCCVDAIQWCILNIVEEPHYNNPDMWKGPCHGIELFNDFTYNVSYNSDLSKSVIDDPNFVIPCYNGEDMNAWTDQVETYNWWFDTYPLEFGEFLLVTALTRGVWLHPLSANDLGFQHIDIFADDINDDQIERRGTISVDPKAATVHSKANKATLKRAMESIKGLARNLEQELEDAHAAEQVTPSQKALSAFLKGLPYGADTAFGYTTLIDPQLKMRALARQATEKKMLDHEYGMNLAEKLSINCLIEGHHYSHTGVYDIFCYTHEEEGEQTFPIQIQGQENLLEPCYQMTEDMEMVFIFHPANATESSNFTYASKDFVWKYELQMKTDDENNEILVHGYFNLRAGQKTHLDLSAKYNKENMKWIRFTCFETCSPQQRAWFIPIKGMAFGEPRGLMRRDGPDGEAEECEVPAMTNKIATVEETDEEADDGGMIIREVDDYFDKVYAVESKDLKFFFDDDEDVNDHMMYAYCMQVMPHQQDFEKLAENLEKEIEEVEEINDPIKPPRILQNVHGYFELASERGLESGLESKGEGTATRLDLCHQWDRETVAPACFKTEDGDAEDIGPVVLFYAIDCKNKPVKPVELNPKPRAITASYNVGETGDDDELVLDNTSPIGEIEHNVWLGQSVVPE